MQYQYCVARCKEKHSSFRSVVCSVDSLTFPLRSDLVGESSESLGIRAVRGGSMKYA